MSFHVLNTHDQGPILFYIFIQYLIKFTGHTSNIWKRWYFCLVLQMNSTRHRLVIWRCKASQPSAWRSQAQGEADLLELWNPSHPYTEKSDLPGKPGMSSVAIAITSNNHTNIFVYNIRSKCFWRICKDVWKLSPVLAFPRFLRWKETCNWALSKSILDLVPRLHSLAISTSVPITILPENFKFKCSKIISEHCMQMDTLQAEDTSWPINTFLWRNFLSICYSSSGTRNFHTLQRSMDNTFMYRIKSIYCIYQLQISSDTKWLLKYYLKEWMERKWTQYGEMDGWMDGWQIFLSNVCAQDFFAISYTSRLFLLIGLEWGELNITLCISSGQMGRCQRPLSKMFP